MAIFEQNPIIFLTKKMWEYSTGNRKKVILYFGMFVVANIIRFLEPLLVAKILNIVQEDGITDHNIGLLLWLISLFLFITIGFWALHGPARILEMQNAFLARINMQRYLLRGTMELPSQWHTDHHSGDTIDKIGKSSGAVSEYAEQTFEVIEVIILLVTSYIALVYFNIHSAYIVLVMVFITFGAIMRFDQTLTKMYRELATMENKAVAKVIDVITNITTVIILRIEKLVLKSIVKSLMRPFWLFKKTVILTETKWFLVTVFSSIMTVLVLGSYIFSQYRNDHIILIGTLYALYGYVNRISETFFRFAYLYGSFVHKKARSQNVDVIANEFRKKKRVRRVDFSGQWRELRVENLRFSYGNNKQEHHLDGIQLTILRGEKIAFIGESGSGKTTTLKIIRELYKPQHLELYLDGEILIHGFASISDKIALIPQDPEIFTTTIRENITVGVPHHLDYIRKFAKMARFDEVAQRLPKKYKSSVVEKGVNLSGGEKQRLAVARGLLASSEKELLLLDEPTSSVDFKNELQIYKNIFTFFHNKTVISSVHRLHLLSLFDKVVLFKHGRIVACGNFLELKNDSHEFQKIWKKYRESNRSLQLDS